MVGRTWPSRPTSLSSPRTGRRPAGAVVHDRRAALLRLLGLPAAVLRRYLRPPAAPEVADEVAKIVAVPGGRYTVTRPAASTTARYVPPGRDVPRRRRARSPDVDADPPPAGVAGWARSSPRCATPARWSSAPGFTTHNLRRVQPGQARGRAPAGLVAGVRRLGRRRRCSTRTSTPCSTSSTRRRRPRVAHPRTEHFAPLFVSLGAAYGADGGGGFDSRSVIDGFWFGLSKRSWQLG